MKRVRALVVDDNRELAENVGELLTGLGEYDVDARVTTSADEALLLAGELDVDLALVDLHLPDARGTDLVARLKGRAAFAEVVIITGDATTESAISAVKAGAFAYVLKPFRGQDLLETVRLALSRSILMREREQLRDELMRSERRHREVVEHVPAFVLGLDAAGNITIWNRTLAQASGFASKEMLGKPGVHLVGDEGEERLLPRKSGGHRIVRWHIAQVTPDGDDSVVYALGIDVTDEREMLRRTLRSERLAAVGTLAAGLAHEVRNPLNSAQLQLELLERRIDKGDTDRDKLKSVTQIVKDEIRRLDRLVNDFLAFAQPRPLELRRTSINELVSAVLALVEPEAERANVALEVQLSEVAGSVQMDSERMRQVLINLIRNAIEAMGQNGRISVRTEPPDQHGFSSIEVTDDGPGFPDEAPVFDAFYTTKVGGTGLGLPIVHRIVSEHVGSIRVTSKPGETRFTIRLPVDVS